MVCTDPECFQQTVCHMTSHMTSQPDQLVLLHTHTQTLYITSIIICKKWANLNAGEHNEVLFMKIVPHSIPHTLQSKTILLLCVCCLCAVMFVCVRVCVCVCAGVAV